MKKILGCLLACMILLTGCGKPTEPIKNSELIRLTLWHYYNGNTAETFSALVHEFNETIGVENGILIDAYQFAGVNELADATVASASKEIGADPLPDIFSAYADNVVRLVELDVIASINDYFTDAELGAYRQEFITEGYLNDTDALKIIPIAKSTEIIYINETDFDVFATATGASYDGFSTWESLAQLAEQYYNWTDEQTPELYDGKALFGVDSLANFMLITTKQLGDDIYIIENDEVSINFQREDAKAIWDVWYTPFIQGYYNADGRFRSDSIKSGELLAYIGSTSSSSFFPKQTEKGKDMIQEITCKTMPYPSFEMGAPVSVQQGAGMVISKSNPEREAAAALFLKWFTDTEQNLRFAVNTGYMPVKNEALNIDNIIAEMKKSPNFIDGSPVVSGAYTAYKQLEEYSLYTSGVFDDSFDCRVVLDTSLPNWMIKDLETLDSRMAAGEDRDDILAELISEENFEQWYSNIVGELESCLK